MATETFDLDALPKMGATTKKNDKRLSCKVFGARLEHCSVSTVSAARYEGKDRVDKDR